MVSEDSVDNAFSAPRNFSTDERRRGIRRLATGTYVVYALIILIQGLILCGNFIFMHALSPVPMFLIPIFFALLILVIAFAREDRGAIALLATLHLGLGALILFFLGCIVWERWEQKQHDNLIWLIIFGNFNLVIPLAALVMYFVESKAPMPKPERLEK